MNPRARPHEAAARGRGHLARDAEAPAISASEHNAANDYTGQPIAASATASSAPQLATHELAQAAGSNSDCDRLHQKGGRQREREQPQRRQRLKQQVGNFNEAEPSGRDESLRKGVPGALLARGGEQWQAARLDSSQSNHCAAVPGEFACSERRQQHQQQLQERCGASNGADARPAPGGGIGISREVQAGARGKDFNCRFQTTSDSERRARHSAAKPVQQFQPASSGNRSVRLPENSSNSDGDREREKPAAATVLWPEASDIADSARSLPIARATLAPLIEQPDDSSFWRRLSNLSRSIVQQQQQQQQQPARHHHHQDLERDRPGAPTSQLAPEVVGYLRKNQRGQDALAADELGAQRQTCASSMTAGEIGESEHRPERSGILLETPASQLASIKEAEMGRQAEAAAAAAVENQQQQMEEAGERMQARPSNQRLIKILETPASIKMRKSSQVDAEAAAALMSNNDGHKQQQRRQSSKPASQIKLSITTTTSANSSTRSPSSGATSLSSCILSDSSSVDSERLKWGKKMDFLLSIIGFAVDLANIWRFPYLVYKNGGGVFLIPYLTMLIFGGIPLFFLELCLGQFVKKGPITVWNKICPYMKGVGYCSILISWYVSFYYNVLIAWSVYFIYRSISSFGDKMPWEDCDNSWNTKSTCVSISQLKQLCATRNESLESCRKDLFSNINVTSPASEFFVKELSQIDQSTGLEDMGYLRPELVFCTIIVYLLHYFSLFRGLETSGKVVWVTATAPYMILSILLVRGLFLPGASMGIEYYLSPKLEKLADPQVWIDAAGQVFYSIGVGFGVHLTFASFNSHDNNCYRDCLMTSAVNALTSVYSGLVVFVYLGYMATNLGIEIDKVASEGYSLVFEVYPEALTTLPFARFWSILFFIMLLTLGIDSAMGGLEAVITGLEDEFKFAKRLSRGQLTGLVIFSSFLPALISCTQGGAYTLFWFDIYSAGVSLLFSALFETIGVVYCYGIDKFILNIESMLGHKPKLFYILCWKYISPLFLMGIIFMSIYTAAVPVYRGYTFPVWSIVLGWCLAFSSVAAVPIVAIYTWCSSGTKAVSVSPSKSPRKPGASSYSASGSRNSATRKSPSQQAQQCKAISVNYGGAGGIQSGLGGMGQMTTTTNIISSPNDHRIKEEML